MNLLCRSLKFECKCRWNTWGQYYHCTYMFFGTTFSRSICGALIQTVHDWHFWSTKDCQGFQKNSAFCLLILLILLISCSKGLKISFCASGEMPQPDCTGEADLVQTWRWRKHKVHKVQQGMRPTPKNPEGPRKRAPVSTTETSKMDCSLMCFAHTNTFSFKH